YSLALHSIDLVTYESVEVDPKLQDEIQKLSFTADSNFYVPPTLFVDHYNPGGFGLYTQSGIYRATDSTLVEIAHAQDTRIADPSKSISECVFINESDFLLVAGDRNNYLSGLALYKYVLGSDVSDATGEIKVYSLKDSADLRYAVTLFKDKYPNVAVTVDIGLSGNLTSVEDAIRSLNIELLSQEGPDVIFLDGLPIESFIKQGILHDVSDIHERLTLSNLYYQAIIDTFLEEGSCYALPARFGLPIVFGSEEMVSSVDSLSDLVEVAKLYSERPGSFLAAPLERTLLLASYNSCFVDGNVDAVGLRSYYECIFEIHSILLDSKVSYPYLGEDFSHVDSEIAGVIEHLLDGSNSFLVALLNEEWDCGITFELSKGYNDAPMEAALLTLGEDNTFIPCATVGIRQSTEDLDLSKEFVEIMFSGDFQEINQRTGLSIMKEIIVSEFTLEGVGLVLIDTNENYYVDEIPEENVAAYKEMFASLNSPVIVDSFIESIVLKQTQLLLSGEITIDDAVDETIKRVSLYLVE
ncbi:MAG: hypothetical protein FWD27_08170, partial [Coriobacteriia bacterium]|nr:hypothetical protein [Coriobacteriia bacterium]